MKFTKFLLSRIGTFILVIFIGVTTVFIIPRFLPSDPVEAMIGQIASKSGSMEPAAVEAMRESLNAAFGLEGTLWEQYTGFVTRVLFTQDFGPSLASYPTPVGDMIARALPWTFTLMLTATVIAWILGNAIGLIAGFKKDKFYSKILEGIAIGLYPIPYYIFALSLIILFCFINPIFPLSFTVMADPGFSWEFISQAVYNCFLPAMSIILVGLGWWVISMKTHVGNIMEEDYVHFAKLKGLKGGKIMRGYVLPNAALPQITTLAMQIGGIFNGSLVCEILFGVPGLGSLIYTGILQADYNLIMGTISISIVSVATTTFIVDMLYPFFDPRIRYS